MASNESNSQSDGPPLSGSSSVNTFLFVNETTAKAGKKVGRRTDIKSHVRNHIVKREKKNKTRDHQATSSTSLTELDQSLTTASKGKERENRSTEYSQASQTGVPISEWNQASSVSVPNPGDSSLLLQPEGNSLSSPNPEASWYSNHAPHDQSQLILTLLPKPNIVSDVLERAIPFTIGKSMERRPFRQEYGTAPIRGKQRSSMSGESNYMEAGHHHLANSQPRNCVICDDPNLDWMDCDQHGSVWEIQGATSDAVGGRLERRAETTSKRQAFASRPLDQLGSLGTVTYLLPGLIADGFSKSSPSLLTISWISAARNTPLLFHALVFSASIHLSFLRTSTIHPNSKISFADKQAVIQQLNQVLNSPTERIRDEFILAILILASHEVMDLNPAEELCFDSPLKKMKWLNVYGNIRNVQEHLVTVMNLVNLRGGIESLELYGLAELLIGGDVVAATTSLSPPSFQPLHRSTKGLQSMTDWSVCSSRPSVMKLGSAFQHLILHGITPSMINLFPQISAITIGITAHLSGDFTAPSLKLIARTRTACQQKLLSLPPRSELNHISEEAPDIYEPIRITANIFGIAVIFPIPRSTGVLQILVTNLVHALEDVRLEHYASVALSNVHLWMLILGGIAAQGKVEGPWFVQQLVDFVRRWGFSGYWKPVEDVLETFLWLDSACGASGRKLWDVVSERRVEMDTNMWLASDP